MPPPEYSSCGMGWGWGLELKGGGAGAGACSWCTAVQATMTRWQAAWRECWEGKSGCVLGGYDALAGDFNLSVLVLLGDPPSSNECVGAGGGGVGVEEVMPKGTPQAEQLLAKGVAALGELVAFLKLKVIMYNQISSIIININIFKYK